MRPLSRDKQEKLRAFLEARMRSTASLLAAFGPNVLSDMRRSGLPIRYADRWRSRGGHELVWWIGDKPRSVPRDAVREMDTAPVCGDSGQPGGVR